MCESVVDLRSCSCATVDSSRVGLDAMSRLGSCPWACTAVRNAVAVSLREAH